MRLSSRWLAGALTLAGFALVTAWLVARVSDNDVWFHMVVGREMLRTKGIPVAEFYKYTLLGQPAEFHEWGCGVVSELAFQAGGFLGLAVLNAGVSAAAVLLVAAAARRRGASLGSVLLLVGPLAVIASYRFQYRPETILYLALGAGLYALEANRWLALPLLTLGLALFHPSPIVLLLVGAAYAVDVGIEERGRSKRLAGVIAVLALAALSVGIAPYGLRQLTLPVELYLQGDVSKMIAEFQPVMQTQFRYRTIAVAGAAALGIVFARPRRASDVLLVVAFGYLAFAHMRNGALFAIVTFGPAAVALTKGLHRLSLPFQIGVALASLATVSVAFLTSLQWGIGAYPDFLPAGTADFIQAHRPPGNIGNELGHRGYLAWRLYPDYLVSADGRILRRDRAIEISDRILSGQPGRHDVARYYGGTMVEATPVNFVSGQLSGAVAALDRSPDWVPVVADLASVLYVKRGLVPDALDLPRERVWSLVRYVADGLAPLMSDAPAVYLTRGTANFKLHDFARAALDFGRYSNLVPSDQEASAFARQLAAAVAGDDAAKRLVEERYAQGLQPPQ